MIFHRKWGCERSFFCTRKIYSYFVFKIGLKQTVKMTLQKKQKLLHIIQDYAIITFGLIMYSLSWTFFLVPAQITGGGVSGLAAVIFYTYKIPFGLTFFGINLLLVAIAIKVIGASFGVKTIYSMVVISIALSVLPALPPEYVIHDNFLAAVLGGMMGGVAIGIVFSRGGSTGGTDIIAMIITKYRNISPGRIIMYCDVIIIGSSYFLLHSIDKMV